MQNVVRPTLVDMATKFRLGAEIQSPTGLLLEKILTVSQWMCHEKHSKLSRINKAIVFVGKFLLVKAARVVAGCKQYPQAPYARHYIGTHLQLL